VTDLRIPSPSPGAARRRAEARQPRREELRERHHHRARALQPAARHLEPLQRGAHQGPVETLKADRRHPDGSEADIEKGEGEKYLNPVYLMTDSGARGNITQMKQLAGMRA
jgi:hypothetical protein